MRKVRSSGNARRHRVVDLAAGFEVAAERLFERHAHRRAGQPRGFEPVDGRLEQGRRGRQENRDPVARVADRLGEILEPVRMIDVERHIMEPRQEAAGHARAVESVRQMFAKRLIGARSKSSIIELGPRSPDHPKLRRAATHRHRGRKAKARACAAQGRRSPQTSPAWKSGQPWRRAILSRSSAQRPKSRHSPGAGDEPS